MAGDEFDISIGEGRALTYQDADLAVAYDSSGAVGGKIDAVEISNAGSVKRLQRKGDCSENEDAQ